MATVDCNKHKASSSLRHNNEKDANDLSKYQFLQQIGQGSYAHVFLAVDVQTQDKVAIKVYQKTKLQDEERLKSVRREIQILNKLNHRNIVQLYSVIETSDSVHCDFAALMSLC